MSKGQSREELRTRIQNINPRDFEHFVGDLWEEEGWSTTVSQQSNDLGVDVVAEKNGTINQKLAIQAKRYSSGNKVGRGDVQKYHSMKVQDSDADAAVLTTTSEFTSPAEEWANTHNVKLLDGDDLLDMTERHGRMDLLEQYAPTLDAIQAANESESSSTSSETSTESKSERSRDPGGWLGWVALAALLQIGGVLLMWKPSAVSVISQNAALWIFVGGWFISPITIFLDAWSQHKSGTGFIPNRVTWPAGAFMIPLLIPLLYISKRG